MPIIIHGSGGATLTDTTINGVHFFDMTYRASDFNADGFETFTIKQNVDVRKITPNNGNLVLSGVKSNPRFAAFVMAHWNMSDFDISQLGALIYLFYDRDSQHTQYPVTYMFTMNSKFLTENLGNSGETQPKCIYDESAQTLTVGESSWHYFLAECEYLCALMY